MHHQEAVTILSEIAKDRRLSATLITGRKRQNGSGYTIKVTLRGSRVLTAGTVEEWQTIKWAWKDL